MLDANILIRGCLRVRVRALIADSAREVDVFVAEANASEASGYISELAARRGLVPQICQEAFLSLMEVVHRRQYLDRNGQGRGAQTHPRSC